MRLGMGLARWTLECMVKIMMKNRVQVHGSLLKKHPNMKTRRPLDLFHFSGGEGNNQRVTRSGLFAATSTGQRASRCTVSSVKAGMQTETYAVSASGVLYLTHSPLGARKACPARTKWV